jgi:hypothetical protein
VSRAASNHVNNHLARTHSNVRIGEILQNVIVPHINVFRIL